MNILVGCTGFVGSNIYEKGEMDLGFHSTDIAGAYGLAPDLLVYAGLKAEKYLANHAPEQDLEQIREAAENIRKIAPGKVVLISTVDVFRVPVGVDETSRVDCTGLHAYGLNRYRLECMVRQMYPDALIVRLPGLFGKGIKKNFIFDYMHVIPSMLPAERFGELARKEAALKDFYVLQDNGFYRCRALEEAERKLLRERFQALGFTALHFTDSRSIYQFYPLGRLWEDIRTALANGLRLLHPATEPVGAGELYTYLTGKAFVNELAGAPVRYDYRTVHDRLYGGAGGYLCGKGEVMEAIRKFTEDNGK